MRKESKYPGYYVNYEDGEVWLDHGRKPLKKSMEFQKVYWKVYDEGVQKSIPAEDIILSAFPNLKKKDYIYSLYRGIPASKFTGRTRTVTIIPGVKLTLIYSYMLEVPLDLDYSFMKDMFPGKQIIVEEGNEVRRWREIYFHSDEHMMVVRQKIADFLEKT